MDKCTAGKCVKNEMHICKWPKFSRDVTLENVWKHFALGLIISADGKWEACLNEKLHKAKKKSFLLLIDSLE